MKLKYNVTSGGQRKRMVAIISREARSHAVYTRMPECAYIIGNIKVTRDGELVWDERTDQGFIEMIVEALEDEGFHPEPENTDEESTGQDGNGGPAGEEGADTAAEDACFTEESISETTTGEAGNSSETPGAEAACVTGGAEENAAAGTETSTPMPDNGGMDGSTEEDAHTSDGAGEDVGGTIEEADETPENAGEGSGKMTISMPRAIFTDTALSNLQKIVDSKRSLLMKSLGVDSLPVDITEGTVSFPWFKNPEGDAVTASAYAHLVEGICRMAREAKRVVATEKETESEKYTFRCFLVRLGFNGPEYKHERAVLMKDLSGHAAFKTQAEADAFYAKLKAKKEAGKQAKAAGTADTAVETIPEEDAEETSSEETNEE